MSERPPLTCALCFAERWNDHTVRWLPLRGLYREPYCADTCSVWVMTGRESVNNGGAEVWAALVGIGQTYNGQTSPPTTGLWNIHGQPSSEASHSGEPDV